MLEIALPKWKQWEEHMSFPKFGRVIVTFGRVIISDRARAALSESVIQYELGRHRREFERNALEEKEAGYSPSGLLTPARDGRTEYWVQTDARHFDTTVFLNEGLEVRDIFSINPVHLGNQWAGSDLLLALAAHEEVVELPARSLLTLPALKQFLTDGIDHFCRERLVSHGLSPVKDGSTFSINFCRKHCA